MRRSSSRTNYRLEVRERQDADARVERVSAVARIDDVDVIEGQILERDPHRPRRVRGVPELELEAQPSSASQNQQVELRAGMGPVEVRVPFRVQQADHLIQCESFPRCAELGVRQHIMPRAKSQEQVQQSGVPEVDAWRLDEALADVLEPWRQ